MSNHIVMARDIGMLAGDLDAYKNGLPLPLKLAAVNCVREMHKFSQELLGDSVGEVYAQDDAPGKRDGGPGWAAL